MAPDATRKEEEDHLESVKKLDVRYDEEYVS